MSGPGFRMGFPRFTEIRRAAESGGLERRVALFAQHQIRAGCVGFNSGFDRM
jgi:hypothetical protein